MKPAIRVEGLGKLFHHKLPRFDTLLGRLRRRLLPDGIEGSTWALRDLSFTVERGECFGVCGPNGAGKSTLLAVIAGILEPTQGRLEVDGRTNAFLSLHAALQPELSVLDNIEICGILMGLRRREILRRTETILDFAELTGRAEVRMAELSAGQTARVSFSTAVHADIDILLVDETLAVGDAAFQAKCVDAFARLRREGKTILTASHDQELLKRIAPRRLRLISGRGEMLGDAPAPAKRSRVLFIGNSLSVGVPGLLNAARFETAQMTESGESLQGHWEKGRAVEAIRSGRWDFVVLQDESSRPILDPGALGKYARLFDAEIKKSGAQTILFATWARRDQAGMQTLIDEAYRDIGRAWGAVVAPIGPVWAKALRERPELELYAGDGNHAGPLGVYLCACVLSRAFGATAPVGDEAVSQETRTFLAACAGAG
jgi:ABC-type polysaccharide/polyol phosphate transport system ATPase subunit